MHARPVIGAVFVKMLSNHGLWKKWSTGDVRRVGDWAPLPKPPVVTDVVPTARRQRSDWQYTTDPPAGDGWTEPGFDAAGWHAGPGGFGTQGTPGPAIGTRRVTDDIWVRRQVKLPADLDAKDVRFDCYHDEDVQIDVDGVPAATESGFNGAYLPPEIDPAALARLKPGATVTIAAHCHQTTGGQFLDVGLAEVVPAAE